MHTPAPPTIGSMHFHIPTMLLMLVVAFGVMALGLAFFAPAHHRALRLTALGLLTHGVGYALLGLRGDIPLLLSILGGNLGITLAAALYLLALYRFQERAPHWWLLALPVLLVGLGMALLQDTYTGRRLLSSLVALCQFAHMALLLWQRRRHTAGRGQYLVMFASLLVCATMVQRSAAYLLGVDSARALTDATPTVVWTFLMVLLSGLLLALGLLMMTQERVEQALSSSEWRYRRLVEAANEGICVLQDGVFRYINPKGTQLFGLPEEALLERPILELIHPDDWDLVRHNYALRIEGKADALRYAVRVLTGPQRTLRWFEISGVRIDWHGRPAGLNFFTDITERRTLEEQIHQLAYHDALTGLPNRRLLIDQLRLAMARNQRNTSFGAVVFLDLDNFKPLNDQHGHQAGDQLLVEVALRLRTSVRTSDTVARLGGDEFVVLLDDLGNDAEQAKAQALQLAGKLIERLSQPYELEGTEGDGPITHRCTASAGVALFAGLHSGAEALLDQADAAMYQAKQAGRNRAHCSGAAAPAA